MKNNICLVISNLAGGGAQRAVSYLSCGLSAYYHPYIILHDGKKVDYPYKGSIVDLKTPVANSVIKKVLNFFIRTVRLRNFKTRIKPVAVVSFMESSNFVNLFSGRKGKTIISVRNYKSKQERNFLGKIFKFFIKRCYNKSDLVITASQGIKNDLIYNFQLTEDKVVVIYNPCDLWFITQKASEPLGDRYKTVFGGPVLITAGSLTKQKGQWHLIRAFKKIKEAIPEMKLVVLGEGELRFYLEQLTAELNLGDDILLPGFQSNPFQFIGRSSIFVLPSLYEGFPNVLIEAMACKVPVIACDCLAGPREILAPETDSLYQTALIEYAQHGVLTPVCSGKFYRAVEPLSREEDMLAKSVIDLYNDQLFYEKLCHMSRIRAEDFTSSRIIKQWVELIEA